MECMAGQLNLDAVSTATGISCRSCPNFTFTNQANTTYVKVMITDIQGDFDEDRGCGADPACATT